MSLLEENINKVIQGHALEVLKQFPAESIDCAFTSPPYFWKREYGTVTIWDSDPTCEHDFSIKTFSKYATKFSREGNTDPKNKKANTTKPVESFFCSKCGSWLGELGQEPTIELYVKHLCDIFDEVKRVLTKYGSLYVNITDSYLKKGLLLIPEQFLLEMNRRGWILCTKIIWQKDNCMPEPTKTRPTVNYELIFFFAKNGKYYFEQQFEPFAPATLKRAKNLFSPGKTGQYAGLSAENLRTYYDKILRGEVRGRNMRAVWDINTEKSREKHTARFPRELVERIINMSCPTEVCKSCTKPRTKIVELIPLKPREQTKLLSKVRLDSMERPPDDDSWIKIIVEKGFSDCGCGKGFRKGIILDCFGGLGTTISVAKKLARTGIGIELNEKYCERANQILAGFKVPAKAEDHLTLDNFTDTEEEVKQT